jgi:lipopolysaccharide transport system permease protein
MTEHDSAPTTIIAPTSGWRFANWRELYAYRDLLRLFVWRDFATRYKQTILGPLWHIFQPLLTTLIFTIIFSHVAQLSTDGLPATLFYLCGLLAWNYFSQTFNATSTTLVANANLFGKVYFPRLIAPLSSVISGLISLAIQFVLFIAVYVLYCLTHTHVDAAPRWQLVFLPLVLLQLAALSLGVGLWLAALTAKFRDFAVLAGFIVQLWMYVTPVIYPLTKVPAQWRLIAALNPVSIPVETFRYVLLGRGAVSLHLYLASIGVTLVALITGILVFQRVEKNFVDVI